MRSALLCVFFILIIRRETVRGQSENFRPTPIPLMEWHYDRRDSRAGTLHETFKTASPPTVATVPAHYWEDALRHSVYLSLVRDKIDQLIVKGDVISPNSKPNGYDSKEIDDHDLWEKVKTAPFNRIPEEELASYGDVTIMAKGRLLEQNGGFRFAEDERTKEKCSTDDCMNNVKAFWSVKRVRQRDLETSPGKYHYELTFSVISQTPKKQRKPYETPIRIFTVKESSPATIIDRPIQTSRPERAIWVHKNIAPSKFVGRKQNFLGLDRIFSSLFSDDDDRSFESPLTKYKQSPYPAPSGSQYSKIGQAGIPIEQHQQIPYAYRSPPMKHVRPPLQAPPTSSNQYQYQDFGSASTTNSIPYVHYPYDHRIESSQAIKTTRPAVLPTPLPPILPAKDQSAEVTNTMSMELTNNGTTIPDNFKMQKVYNNNKYKNTPVKVNYFSDHVRPPVFNAPPGVFVTMDKKPFKPMPPLKLVHSTAHRTNKPIDFRPSPQILDQPIDPDSFADTAFRPITMKYADSASSEKDEVTYSNKNKIRKTNTTTKKPLKKHESIKSHRVTTSTPEIITAQSSSGEEVETMDWANILGSFTKTTPMVSQTEKIFSPDTTTPMTTTTITTTKVELTTPTLKTTTSTEASQETTLSTTLKPKRRTRPPPKFVKQEKIKKHKRITTTTTTSTTTTNAPENLIKRRPIQDQTPLASSAPTDTMKVFKEPNNRTMSTTTTTTTTTTTKPTTTKTTKPTTTQAPTTSTTVRSSTTQPKNKNRFRQSTLMYKGTSVKHDKWREDSSGILKNQTATTSHSPPSSLHRRKGSNFQGYISSTTPRFIDEEKERERENHTDRKLIVENKEKISVSSEMNLQTNPTFEETAGQYESNSVIPLEKSEELIEENESDEVSKDHAEYIFQQTKSSSETEENTTPKIKGKCKKKKLITSTEDSTNIYFDTPRTTTLATTITTTKTTTEAGKAENDILEELLNYSFSENDKTPRTEILDEAETSNHETYLNMDDDVEDFLGVLHGENKNDEFENDQYSDDDEETGNDDEETDDDDETGDESDEDDEYDSKIPSFDDDTESNSAGKKETSRDINNNDSKDRPYSFLELMAMS